LKASNEDRRCEDTR